MQSKRVYPFLPTKKKYIEVRSAGMKLLRALAIYIEARL